MSVFMRLLRLLVNPPFADTYQEFQGRSEANRRKYIYKRFEHAKVQEYTWVVVVAGVGFFTDAYSIFAINMVIPILGIVYYQSNQGIMPHNYQTALSVVTLGGTIIGQIAFGWASDVWGRRKMYGVELIITIGATLGMVMASDGVHGSMSLFIWLLVWRFVLGFGIGAEQVLPLIVCYPLSAVICAEFAPTRLRGKMMTAVFACQPLGQLAATLVALMAAAQHRDGIPSDSSVTKCNDSCMKTLDSVWRWIIGAGVIPAFLALWFRLTIIESPRYTADVLGDSSKAAAELQNWPERRSHSSTVSTSMAVVPVEPVREVLAPVSRASSGQASAPDSGVPSDDPPAHGEIPEGEPYLDHPATNPMSSRNRIPRRPVPGQQSGNTVDMEQAQLHPRARASNEASRSPRNISPMYRPATGPPPVAPHTPLMSDPTRSRLPNNASDQPPKPSWEDFKNYFWRQGNFRVLIATSLCWFCVDFPFYGLGMNSPQIISIIWYGSKPPPSPAIYPLLIHNVWQSLIVVSLGAILGCIITFVAIDTLGRRCIQMIGFFWLFILFVVIGSSFEHLYEVGGQAAVVVLYILCQIFFNFGPNVTTYILPAELFPTRYRGLCHGLSAACGKLGSVIAQLFLAYINYGRGPDGQKLNYKFVQWWLPYSLLIFSSFMVLGFGATYKWLPHEGKVKTLEEWAVGLENLDFPNSRRARIFKWCWKVAAWGLGVTWGALLWIEEREPWEWMKEKWGKLKRRRKRSVDGSRNDSDREGEGDGDGEGMQMDSMGRGRFATMSGGLGGEGGGPWGIVNGGI